MTIPAVPAPDITLVYTHQAYRALAAPIAGVITPELKAELWAKAEVNAKKRRNAMIDIEQARSNMEPSDLPTPLKYGDTVRIVADSNEDTWQGKTGIIKRFRGNGKGGLAAAEVEIEGKRRYFAFEDLIAIPADDAKLDALVEAHEPVAIERPGGEHTIGIPVISAANAAPDGMVPVRVAPGVIETVERFEVKTLDDVLKENAALKLEVNTLRNTLNEQDRQVAELEDDYNGYRQHTARELAEKDKQLAALHTNQQMTPLARAGGAVEVCYFCEAVNTEGYQVDAAHKLGALRSENWTIVYEQFIIDNGWTKHHVARLERQTRAIEPKPEADKPANVRDFPIPDADLTAEDDGVSALACVPAAVGMGNRGVVRRVGGMR